jgi:NADH-quinone oxidoreductase subunit C
MTADHPQGPDASEVPASTEPEPVPEAPASTVPEPEPEPLPPHLAAISAGLGPSAEVTEQFDRVLATVPAADWVAALTAARDELGADFLDWLTGVDELEAGYLIAAFVVSTADRGPGKLGKAQGLILRTRIPKDARQGATLASAIGVYRGAAWHERETHEMFGIEFTGHEGLKPLLLPDGFEGHPLRKDFVLAARVAKAWPGAKEPGESEHHAASPGRRRMLPPGVPGDEWLKPYRAPEPSAVEGAPADSEPDASAGAGPEGAA